jgi:predicted PurR-regulated permease PerM
MKFEQLCTPARIYFILAIISSIFALFHGIKIITVFINLIIAFIWTYLLSWICKKGYKTISWVLVLFPYLVMFLAFLGIRQFATQSRTALKFLPPSAI